ncbi:HAD family hydrolase [Roseibium suaedae]|uniref:Putative hydrolase of the HAD superfamily n=1 Tax=Roseibium suaedae TaxID=735517 RepID=A0A1M7LCD9_9HYPH|nr:HAD family hydrolase [Roseibium suaedae]SHM75540.1 putative hydrolase of the HAD superfamily [Roseibium suaedae]
MPITTLGFDADDTLWHNESVFHLTEERFAALLADHADKARLQEQLLAAERRNLKHYGYGIKGFVLSMIETALEVTEGKAPGAVISQILDAGRDMMTHPVEPLPHVTETLSVLKDDYRLVLITKGDLFDQERKIAESGLADWFDAIEIVSEKSAATYRTLFARHGSGPSEALMTGNSVKSDILPALEAGSIGVHVPYAITWGLERAEAPANHDRFHRLDHIGKLPELLTRLGQDGMWS